MQKQASKKPLIIVIVLIVLAAGGYFYMSGDATNADLGLVPTAESIQTSEAGNRVLVLLRQVKGLKIDNTFFQSQAYSTLVDHTVPIYPQNIGKPNPFLTRQAPAAAQTSTQRTTGR